MKLKLNFNIILERKFKKINNRTTLMFGVTKEKKTFGHRVNTKTQGIVNPIYCTL